MVVCQHFWPETFRINDMCKFLIDKNCDVEVLCGIPNYPSGKFFDGYSLFKNRRQNYKGIDIHRVTEIPRGSNTNLRIFINYISFPFFSLFHIPRLMFNRYDKILVFTYSPIMMAISGLIVGRLKKIETTMYVLDLWPENLFSVLDVRNRLLRSFATRVSHWHYRQADKFLVLSESMRKRILEITKTDSKNILYLPQACEKLYEKDIHDKTLAKRFNKGFNIVFTGNISPAQSFPTVIEAAKLVRDKGIKDINWIIVGDGMSKQDVMNQVKESGLGGSFFFEGQKPVEDIPRYTGIADGLLGCLVKSNLLEATIPAKVTSYLASGRPMILAMDGEARHLVNDLAKCGYASPTEDSTALADNIIKLYKLSPAQRKAMGKRGRDYHFKHLERNLILNKFYKFLFNKKTV